MQSSPRLPGLATLALCLLLATTAGVTRRARAQAPGDLDPSFTTALQNQGEVLTNVRFFPLADGRILLAGDFKALNGFHSPGVVRLYPDGSLDPSFTSGLPEGAVVTALVVLPDGRLLVNAGTVVAPNPGVGGVGLGPTSVSRLLPDGGLDSTFFGGWRGQAGGLTRQADGRLLLGGGDFVLPDGRVFYGVVRLDADGGWDPSFVSPFPVNSSYGVAQTAVQSDSKIIIRGGFDSIQDHELNGLARLYPDGRLDPGYHAQATPGPLTLLPNDEVLILTTPTRMVRLSLDGAVDPAFREDGLMAGQSMKTFAVRDDGKILVVGSSGTVAGPGNSFASVNGVVLLNADGSRDLAFNPGVGSATVSQVAFQADRRALLSGTLQDWQRSPRNGLVRIYTDPAGMVAPPVVPAPTLAPSPAPLPAPPTVTVTATVPQVLAGSGQAGVFTLTRDEAASLDADLLVTYQVGGSAVGGVDYATLPGVKRIAAGQRSARVKVHPLGGGGVATARGKVRLSLAPGPGYQLGSPQSAKVKIQD